MDAEAATRVIRRYSQNDRERNYPKRRSVFVTIAVGDCYRWPLISKPLNVPVLQAGSQWVPGRHPYHTNQLFFAVNTGCKKRVSIWNGRDANSKLARAIAKLDAQ